MRKQTGKVTYYCDDCKKEIATVEDRPMISFELLEIGIFRPKYGQESEDVNELCKDCMLKLIDKWREEVSGH